MIVDMKLVAAAFNDFYIEYTSEALAFNARMHDTILEALATAAETEDRYIDLEISAEDLMTFCRRVN